MNSTAAPRPVFIVNPNAGRFRRDPSLLARLTRAVGDRADVLPTRSEADLSDAAGIAVHASGPVVLCGGDGTHMSSITALVRAAKGGRLPRLVLARGGTVSIAAKNWGGDRDLERVLHGVIERPQALRFVHRPTLAVRDDAGVRIGFTFGTGLVANFFVEYERSRARGNRTAAAIAVRTFIGSLTGGAYAARILSPLRCRVSVDGNLLEHDAFSLVVASVLRDVGLHFLVTHRASEDPARPHLVASPLTPRALGPQWLRVARGLPLLPAEGAGNFDGLVGSFRVDFPDDTGPYVLDGDSFRTRSVTVAAGPLIHVAT